MVCDVRPGCGALDQERGAAIIDLLCDLTVERATGRSSSRTTTPTCTDEVIELVDGRIAPERALAAR